MAAVGENTRDGRVRRAWLVALGAAWIIGSVYLVSWALGNGLTDDAGFSPYHLPGYAGLAVLTGAVVVAAGNAVRHRRGWLQPFGDGLELVPVAVGVLLAYVLVDLLWREIVGIGPGIEGALAPSRVLLPLALGLLAVTPLRLALADPGRSRGVRLAAVLGVGLAGPALSIALGAFHPIGQVWSAAAADTRLDDSELWVMQGDGGRQTRVLRAADGIEVSLGDWAPDGARIAYTRWDTGSEGNPGELWVANADGSDAVAVTTGSATDWIPDWSPDGAWIAYTAERESPATTPLTMGALPEPGRAPGGVAGGDGGSDLWLVRPDGTEPHAVTSMPGGEYLAAWSPDGTRIAFGNQVDAGSGDLYVLDVESGNVTPLVDRAGFDWAPAWSPDGSTIAFESDADGSFDIWSVRTDGTDLRRLTDDGGAENMPVWSPDGARIAFVSDTTGDGEIWSMARDGTDQRNLTESPSTGDGYWGLDWAADGTIVYATSGTAPASTDSLVRLDLAAAGLLLRAILLAVLALLLVPLGPPFGALAVLLGLDALFAATVAGQWVFVPAAVVAGLLVDLAVAQSTRRRAWVAAAGVAAGSVVAQAATLFALGTSGWTLTLWLGTALAAGLAGAGLAAATETLASTRRPRT